MGESHIQPNRASLISPSNWYILYITIENWLRIGPHSPITGDAGSRTRVPAEKLRAWKRLIQDGHSRFSAKQTCASNHCSWNYLEFKWISRSPSATQYNNFFKSRPWKSLQVRSECGAAAGGRSLCGGGLDDGIFRDAKRMPGILDYQLDQLQYYANETLFGTKLY